jgi:uncharacterized protein YqkB
MYLKITDAAKNKLEDYLNQKATIILDLDDGVGKYSKMGICSLDTSFRILILDKTQDLSDFTVTLDSDIGEVYIKDYSKMYMDEQMTLDLDERLHMFKLSGPSGSLDSHVPIVDLRPERMS